MQRRLTVKGGKRQTFSVKGDHIVTDFTGDFEFEIVDLDSYVQVRYIGGGFGYTYRDPSGTLKVGDIVEVPVGSYGTKLGKVIELGRGNYSGPIKDVAARLVTEAL